MYPYPSAKAQPYTRKSNHIDPIPKPTTSKCLPFAHLSSAIKDPQSLPISYIIQSSTLTLYAFCIHPACTKKSKIRALLPGSIYHKQGQHSPVFTAHLPPPLHTTQKHIPYKPPSPTSSSAPLPSSSPPGSTPPSLPDTASAVCAARCTAPIPLA